MRERLPECGQRGDYFTTTLFALTHEPASNKARCGVNDDDEDDDDNNDEDDEDDLLLSIGVFSTMDTL
ncbi:hypothetical protein M0802_007131 [Mischocyttarus mexicanus]|nr:hypothetical protein M0802_007131 [Mischocyttarus mexicanus]